LKERIAAKKFNERTNNNYCYSIRTPKHSKRRRFVSNITFRESKSNAKVSQQKHSENITKQLEEKKERVRGGAAAPAWKRTAMGGSIIIIVYF